MASNGSTGSTPKGNNGVGNGVDGQPPGNPPINDAPGTSPGNPGNKGGTPSTSGTTATASGDNGSLPKPGTTTTADNGSKPPAASSSSTSSTITQILNLIFGTKPPATVSTTTPTPTSQASTTSIGSLITSLIQSIANAISSQSTASGDKGNVVPPSQPSSGDQGKTVASNSGGGGNSNSMGPSCARPTPVPTPAPVATVVAKPQPTPKPPVVVAQPTPAPAPKASPTPAFTNTGSCGGSSQGTTITFDRTCSTARSDIPYPQFVFFEEAKHPILSVEAAIPPQNQAGGCMGMSGYGENNYGGTATSNSCPASPVDPYSQFAPYLNQSICEPGMTYVLLTSVNLTGVDMLDAKYTTTVNLTSALSTFKQQYPSQYRNALIHFTVCDDTNNNGKCSDETGANTLSVDEPALKANEIPTRLSVDVWSGRGLTAGANPEQCELQYSPLVLDLTGQGITLTSPENGVMFDLNDTGQPIATAWLATTTEAFLVRDVKGTGRIDSGAQMFGTATLLPNGQRASNGFQALAQFDDDHDGKITPNDAIWKELFLWTDKNFNGVSEKGEIMSLRRAGIQYIDLNAISMLEVDKYGNTTKFRSTYSRIISGRPTPLTIIDVWFNTLIGH